jgi:hypothetical protein
MKLLFLLPVFLLAPLAHAKVERFPVSVNVDGLFKSGTNTYLSLVASPELDKQIEAACGADGQLLNLDVHYVVKPGGGFDVSNIELKGIAECRTYH